MIQFLYSKAIIRYITICVRKGDVMPEKSKWEYHELVITGEGMTDFYVCPKCKGAFATDLCQINGTYEINAGESFKFCPYCGKELGGVEHGARIENTP